MKRYKISALVAMLFLPCLHLKAQENNIDFWVGRYMSVSYPLKQIKINSHFGWRKDPFTGKRRLHKGIDLDTAHDPVMAMFDGYVQDIGSDGGNGNYIVLNHGDYTVCYCHLSRITTVKDAQVKAGDIVGISGSTGRSTGDHLHLTSRYKGELRDPYTLLQYITSTKEICVKLLAMKGLPSDSEDNFLAYFAEAAMEQQRLYGIPASVTLAQMALESEWGRSSLARTNNNYFGIKASSQWLASQRPIVYHTDDKPNEKFCVFSDVWESMEYHSRLLMGKRYSVCHQFNEQEYHGWLLGIKASGYATAKDYVLRCEQIIKKHKLYLFDQIAMTL